MKKRIFSFFMVLTLVLPCFAVPTSAALALPGGVAAGATGLIQSSALAAGAVGVIERLADMAGTDEKALDAILSYLVSVTGYGNLGHDGLQAACNRLNQIAANPDKYAKQMYDDCISIGYDLLAVDFELFYTSLVQVLAYQNDLVDGWHIIDHPDYGYVIVNQPETFILADSVGRYPYAQEITDKWLGSRTALEASTVHLLTDYSMKDLQAVHETLHPDWSFRRTNVSLYDGKYTVLQAASDGIHYDQILCDELGFPYGIPQGNTQMGNDRDYNNDKEGQPEVSDEPIVDIDGDLVMQMFPDGSFTWINNLLYDASEKTYYLDSSATYNTTNNYTYNYEWHYTYHIDYTSITYIGQTEEYNEKYEYYFDLPDGRSSADLTAEELQALNTQIDVLPYVRSADDVSIRALYHFDGNTRDSSYWSHLGNLKWNKGATLTYMDVGAFNGALYLDENEHNFTITLPSAPGLSDFTLQWRYYQSYTAAPVTDSSVNVGGAVMLQFNGASILNPSGTVLSPVSVGNWQEIALMRKSGTVYVFHNGVVVGSFANSTSLNNAINFAFGSQQQTYKYFDELRFVQDDIYSTSGYTPSSVPHDTNLSLVLPDSQLPVADEYWDFNTTGNLFPVYDYTQYYDLSVYLDSVPKEEPRTYELGPITGNEKWVRYYVSNTSVYGVGSGYLGGITQFTNTRTATASPLVSSYVDPRVFYFPLGYYRSGSGSMKGFYSCLDGFELDKSYTFSLLLADGTLVSVPFEPTSSYTTFNNYVELPGGGYIGATLYNTGHSTFIYNVFLYIIPPVGGSIDVLYMELKEGAANTGHELVSSVVVMDKDDLNTPSLAVRTDLDITGYQIGGVRPSLPTKGLVWALVEAGRISSLQIYDGQAWEQVDGRIWTGSRWVPYYAYDVLLLKDLWDIVEGDPTLDFIYTEEGFWKWLQDAWGQMMGKLDQIIAALGGTVKDPASECLHTYSSKVAREPTCTEPGHMTYTCDLCGHTYTELIDPTGHDWVVTDTVPDVLDEEGNVIEEGYEELTCSKCDTISRDYGDGPEEVDLFDALGDFIADGISWILDKLTELADSLKGITETFNGFVEKVKGLAGGYPAFFGAFMALIPEDIATILWFAVIGFVVLAVWKKWSN